MFTVEINTHKLMADPRTVPVETFEQELVDTVTRYLRGDQQAGRVPLRSGFEKRGPAPHL